MENNRVTLFFHLLQAASPAPAPVPAASSVGQYQELGELMYQSHDAYSECGLGSSATSKIVDLVRSLGPSRGLFGAKITGGGAGGTVAVLGLRSAADVFLGEVVAPYARMRRENGQSQPHVFSGSSLSADAFGVRSIALF
jgi:L-arabinokinase